MSQIDPWSLPQGSGAPGDAGIPHAMAMPAIRPISKALPLATMIVAALYSATCLVGIFVFGSRASLAESMSGQDPYSFSQDTIDRAHAADAHVNAVLVVAVVLFIPMIILWIAMQRRIRNALPPGVFQAVYKRAGGLAVRVVWWVSIVLVVLSRGTNAGSDATLSQIAGHDHMNMAYLGVRVVLGALIVVYTARLMRVTDEGIARINAAR